MALTTADLQEHARRMIQAFDAAQARYGKAAWVSFDPASGVFRAKQKGTGEQIVILCEAATWEEFWKRLVGEVVDANAGRAAGTRRPMRRPVARSR